MDTLKKGGNKGDLKMMFYSMRSTIPYNNEITGRLNIANTIFFSDYFGQ